ncbi:alpha-2-HS-glycoprotein-like [Notolabrus celidotus]|uniref:alpha-2-HS-glycoprotein-like n=1 Tax=Notolabrus celidotus TaxID=1203425 RepID=UPI00149080C9|nr:alpha-2-HS-glycoprotein-like [Notolabrus celidotus]
MMGLSTLVLLSSVALLCSAAPALEPVTCSFENINAAARLAMHHLNMYHEHGYRFRLLEVAGSKMGQTDTGCTMELNLNLWETDCHTVNPKHFEDCEFRQESDRAVAASCTVQMTVVYSDAQVKSYKCVTKKALSDEEMAMTCPDCPPIISLTDPQALKAAQAAVKQFNLNTTNQHYFVLKEVGRTKLAYIPGVGMRYYSEVALIESQCPMFSRVVPESCNPLCSERAQHALCKASYSAANGISHLECEYYPPSYAPPLAFGEQEPVCVPTLPLSPAGPPGSQPTSNTHHCSMDSNSAFHPICPWP